MLIFSLRWTDHPRKFMIHTLCSNFYLCRLIHVAKFNSKFTIWLVGTGIVYKWHGPVFCLIGCDVCKDLCVFVCMLDCVKYNFCYQCMCVLQDGVVFTLSPCINLCQGRRGGYSNIWTIYINLQSGFCSAHKPTYMYNDIHITLFWGDCTSVFIIYICTQYYIIISFLLIDTYMYPYEVT